MSALRKIHPHNTYHVGGCYVNEGVIVVVRRSVGGPRLDEVVCASTMPRLWILPSCKRFWLSILRENFAVHAMLEGHNIGTLLCTGKLPHPRITS